MSEQRLDNLEFQRLCVKTTSKEEVKDWNMRMRATQMRRNRQMRKLNFELKKLKELGYNQ